MSKIKFCDVPNKSNLNDLRKLDKKTLDVIKNRYKYNALTGDILYKINVQLKKKIDG